MDRLLVALAVLALVGVAAVAWSRAAARRQLPRRVDPVDVGAAGPDGVAVVAFASRYCLPCQEWERALSEAGVPFARVDVGRRPDLARRYGIRATPAVLAVERPGGRVVASWDAAPAAGDVQRLQALAA